METLKVAGRSIIAAIHGHKTNAKYTYIEAPADLMYGFRGNDEGVDLMSPFEMWRFYRIEKVLPPSFGYHVTKLTSAGHDFKKQGNDTADMQPGLHFKVQPRGMYVMLQEIEALRAEVAGIRAGPGLVNIHHQYFFHCHRDYHQ